MTNDPWDCPQNPKWSAAGETTALDLRYVTVFECFSSVDQLLSYWLVESPKFSSLFFLTQSSFLDFFRALSSVLDVLSTWLSRLFLGCPTSLFPSYLNSSVRLNIFFTLIFSHSRNCNCFTSDCTKKLWSKTSVKISLAIFSLLFASVLFKKFMTFA